MIFSKGRIYFYILPRGIIVIRRGIFFFITFAEFPGFIQYFKRFAAENGIDEIVFFTGKDVLPATANMLNQQHKSTIKFFIIQIRVPAQFTFFLVPEASI